MLNEHVIAERLGTRPFRYFDSIGSTNDMAAEWLREGASAGAVVIANEQKTGRGRQGRQWQTPPDTALAVSVILRPSADRAGLSSMIGALAVVDLCHQLGITDAGIKWPNDVQITGKKVSGILPEAIWSQNQLLGVVLGMGLNVRVPFTAELASIATSLETVVQRPLQRADLVKTLLDAVDTLTTVSSVGVLRRWRDHLTTIGQRVTVNDVTGVAIDTDSTGALLIRSDAGHLDRVVAGDVLLR